MLLCGASACRPQAPAGGRANLLLITVDTLRADHLGAYGDTRVDTPALDRFAAEALVFEDAYSAIPITVPSLASLFSSRHPRNHGALNNAYDFPQGTPTLAQLLEANGYRCAAFLPTFLANKAGFRAGFENYSAPALGEPARSGREVVGLGLDWLEQVEAEGVRPWFLWVHLIEPHSPYAPGHELERKYVPAAAFPIPDHLRSEVFLLPVERSAREVEIVRGLYAGEVELADRALAPLLDFAREHAPGAARAAAGPLLSIVTADHGELLYEHEHYIGHTGWLFEEMLRVPLLLHFSNGYRAGERSVFPASLLDLLPTALGALGQTPPAWAEGVDLLTRGAERDRQLVHETFAPEGHFDQQALRLGEWKLLLPVAAPGADARSARLFDLAQAPGESSDLAPGMPQRVLDLEAYFQAWARLQRDPKSARKPEVDEATRIALEKLGYLQGEQEGQR